MQRPARTSGTSAELVVRITELLTAWFNYAKTDTASIARRRDMGHGIAHVPPFERSMPPLLETGPRMSIDTILLQTLEPGRRMLTRRVMNRNRDIRARMSPNTSLTTPHCDTSGSLPLNRVRTPDRRMTNGLRAGRHRRPALLPLQQVDHSKLPWTATRWLTSVLVTTAGENAPYDVPKSTSRRMKAVPPMNL